MLNIHFHQQKEQSLIFTLRLLCLALCKTDRVFAGSAGVLARKAGGGKEPQKEEGAERPVLVTITVR